jgi:hypothetical protein
VVESVSAELVTSTSGSLYTMQLNGPFTLFMIPALFFRSGQGTCGDTTRC